MPGPRQSDTAAPALPWGLPEHSHTREQNYDTNSTSEPEAASVAAGGRIEVLWELGADDHTDSVAWIGAEVLKASAGEGLPDHTFRIKYDATESTSAEESTVTFTLPGMLKPTEYEGECQWRHELPGPHEADGEDPVPSEEQDGTDPQTYTLTELMEQISSMERLMGRSVDERLAEQLKGLPADKQLHMAEGFLQWTRFMAAKLAGIHGTVQAEDVQDIARQFQRPC